MMANIKKIQAASAKMALIFNIMTKQQWVFCIQNHSNKNIYGFLLKFKMESVKVAMDGNAFSLSLSQSRNATPLNFFFCF